MPQPGPRRRGPHVTAILIDGSALLSRATAASTPLTTPWLQRLRDQIERQRTRSEGLEQSHLFEQVTNVLGHLAGSQPLLLIVDDLQWADWASTELLFHLGRRLPGHRILVAAAYRPEEVILSRDGGHPGNGTGRAGGEDHPLGKVLAEFKQQYGDVWVDLSRPDPHQDRTFVDAFLDTEPNLLGEDFRGALFACTAGHPLFTVELLRSMQERQDLKRDEGDRWIEGSALDWETLPARVEGAIEQRIGRLGPELRDLLAVASVEGEEFTAQVVAFHAAGNPERFAHHGEQGLAPYQPQKLYYMVFPMWWAKAAVRILPLFGQDPAAMGRNRDINLKQMVDQESQAVTTRINISPYLGASEQAARCHASQISGGYSQFPRFLRKWLLRFDRYARIAPPFEEQRIECDLFAGVVEDQSGART